MVERSNKILVVDDNSAYQRLVLESMKDQGDGSLTDHILFAENGEEALKLYAEYYPILTLMDVKMPKRDGTEIAMDIRKIDANASIMFLTNFPKDPKAMEVVAKHVVMGSIDKNYGTNLVTSMIGFVIKIARVAM